MKHRAVPALIAALVLLSGCGSMKVSCESDASYRFGGIRTYRWADVSPEELGETDGYRNEDIRHALDGELNAMGIHQAPPPAEPDVQVALHLGLEQQTEYAPPNQDAEGDVTGGVVFSRDTKTWDYREPGQNLHAYTVEFGTLRVFIQDAATNTRIWSGTVETKIDRSASDEKQLAVIQRMAARLMRKLPR